MQWGNFGTVHLLTLVIAAAMIVALELSLKKASLRVKTVVLGVLSFSGIAAIIFNLMAWDAPLYYLPLHLCSINAMLLPFAVFSRNKTLGNLLLVWCLGALAALVLNYEMVSVEIPSWTFFFYYFPHVMEFGIPLLLLRLKIVEKDFRCIGSTIGISAAIYTVVHFCNLAINNFTDAEVNYMFSIEATNPLTKLFYQLIPCQYWYMYLVFPILGVYLVIVYLPDIIRYFKDKKANKTA